MGCGGPGEKEEDAGSQLSLDSSGVEIPVQEP